MVAFILLKLQHDGRYRIRFIMPSHVPLENNLNRIVKDFLKGGEDYWLNIDADNPPAKNPLELVPLDKDVIGLPTPVWYWTEKECSGNRPVYWNGYVAKRDGYTEWPEKKGLQEVDAIGGGCFLAARRVFEHPEMQKGAFLRTWNDDGTVDFGNDLAFSKRAKLCGFRIYCHYDYHCHHFREVDLVEVIKAYAAIEEPHEVNHG